MGVTCGVSTPVNYGNKGSRSFFIRIFIKLCPITWLIFDGKTLPNTSYFSRQIAKNAFQRKSTILYASFLLKLLKKKELGRKNQVLLFL